MVGGANSKPTEQSEVSKGFDRGKWCGTPVDATGTPATFAFVKVPCPDVLRWAESSVGEGARVIGWSALRDGGNPWMLQFQSQRVGQIAVLKVGSLSDPLDRKQLSTQVAALGLAEELNVRAPRVLGVDLEGRFTGVAALLTSALPGSTKMLQRTSVVRLHRLGALAASLHSFALSPRPELPLRTRPLYDVDFSSWRNRVGSNELIDVADQYVRDHDPPSSRTVLVHGDLWQGNTVWESSRCTGAIDWDCAGAGAAGIDLGTLRLDAALHYGLDAADQVIEGWRCSTGALPDEMPYWDLVASLTTVDDMALCRAPAEHGRSDIPSFLLGQRRDAFLRAALTQVL